MQKQWKLQAQNKAAIERAFPNGYDAIHLGDSDVFLLKSDFPTCSQPQRKPKVGEEVALSRLRDDLMVRVCDCYCFDFVNDQHRYILKPDDVRIYSVATAFTPSTLISREQAVENARR